MEIIGQYMVYLIMACCFAGAVASIVKQDSGLGNAFEEGVGALKDLMIPICGVMASVPYLKIFTEKVFAPVYNLLGADPALAPTIFIPADLGGYQLAKAIAASPENWIMAMLVSYMLAPIIIFGIPVGLAIIPRKDHGFLAMGVMSGILAVPIGVLTTSLILWLTQPNIRSIVSTTAVADYRLNFQLAQIFLNLLPLMIFCLVLAGFLKFMPRKTIKGFMVYGWCVMSVLKLVFAFSIIEYFTGFFSTLFGGWGFDPLFADGKESIRAVEIAGMIALMLTGAFPMVYLIQTYLKKPLHTLGKRIGLSAAGSAGVIGATANTLVLMPLIQDMPPRDKVKSLAFSVCGGFMLGDFLAYSANFQPTLIVPIFLGQLTGGLIGVFLAGIFYSEKAALIKA